VKLQTSATSPVGWFLLENRLKKQRDFYPAVDPVGTHSLLMFFFLECCPPCPLRPDASFPQNFPLLLMLEVEKEFEVTKCSPFIECVFVLSTILASLRGTLYGVSEIKEW